MSKKREWNWRGVGEFQCQRCLGWFSAGDIVVFSASLVEMHDAEGHGGPPDAFRCVICRMRGQERLVATCEPCFDTTVDELLGARKAPSAETEGAVR